jgi:sugar lactone lactonase YvrE
LMAYQLTAPNTAFINDVIVTRQAAYFTDSFNPNFYRLPLAENGRLPDPAAVEEIPLGDGFEFIPGGFNANGIEASANGRYLIIVNSSAGTLYRVDPITGEALPIDLDGGAVTSGDGLVRKGRTLYVVRNFLNQVAVVELGADYTSGEIVDTITSDAFRIPTTADIIGNFLYVVNARFDVPPTPDTEYEIVLVRR